MMDDFALSLSALDAEVISPERMLAQLRYDVDRETAERSDIVRTVDDGRNEERWTDDAGNMPIVIGENADMAVGLLSAEQVDLGGGASLKAVDGRVGTDALAIGDSGVLGSIVGGAGEVFSDSAGNEPVFIDATGRLVAENVYAEKFTLGSSVMTDAGGALSFSAIDVGGVYQTQIVTGFAADTIFSDAAGNIKIAIYPDRVVIDGFEQEDTSLNDRYTAWIDSAVNLHIEGTGNLVISPAASGVSYKSWQLLHDRLRWLVDRGAGVVREEEMLIFPSTLASSITVLAGRFQSGQSLSAGVANDAALTTASPKPGFVVSETPGVRLLGNSQNGPDGAGVALQRSSLLGFADAIERHQGTSGETGLVRYGQRVSDRLGNTWGVLVGSTGISGQKYEQWGVPGQAIFENLILVASRARVQTALLGLGLDLKYSHLVGGESDKLKLQALFQSQLVQYQIDLTARFNAIVPGTGDVVIVLNQFSSWTRGETGSIESSEVTLAQLQVALDAPTKFVCIGPIYFLPYDSDGIHLSPIGQLWRGEIAGEYENRHATGGNAMPLHIASATLAGNVWTGTVAGLDGALTLDTTAVTDPGNYGLHWAPASGNTATIANIAISGSDKIVVTFTAPPAGTLGFGTHGTIGNDAGPTTGPRTNFRDSATLLVSNDGAGTILRKWLCHQQLSI